MYRKKQLIKDCSFKIKSAQNNLMRNKPVEPFIKINSAPWYIVDLIPGISPAVAKKVANYTRKNGRFNNFVEFANFTGLDLQFYSLTKNILIY